MNRSRSISSISTSGSGSGPASPRSELPAPSSDQWTGKGTHFDDKAEELFAESRKDRLTPDQAAEKANEGLQMLKDRLEAFEEHRETPPATAAPGTNMPWSLPMAIGSLVGGVAGIPAGSVIAGISGDPHVEVITISTVAVCALLGAMLGEMHRQGVFCG